MTTGNAKNQVTVAVLETVVVLDTPVKRYVGDIAEDVLTAENADADVLGDN